MRVPPSPISAALSVTYILSIEVSFVTTIEEYSRELYVHKLDVTFVADHSTSVGHTETVLVGNQFRRIVDPSAFSVTAEAVTPTVAGTTRLPVRAVVPTAADPTKLYTFVFTQTATSFIRSAPSFIRDINPFFPAGASTGVLVAVIIKMIKKYKERTRTL